jgi:hypothetical protein
MRKARNHSRRAAVVAGLAALGAGLGAALSAAPVAGKRRKGRRIHNRSNARAVSIGGPGGAGGRGGDACYPTDCPSDE